MNSSTPSSSKPPPSKRLRRSFALAEKLHILNRLASGDTASKVSREFDVNESTIRNMRKQEALIRKTASIVTPKVASASLRTRNIQLAKAEVCITTWLEDMRAKRLPVWVTKVRAKALQLYELFDSQSSSYEREEFSASKGWLERLKKRHGLQQIRHREGAPLAGEEEFKSVVKNAVDSDAFTREQVFAADSTEFYWKRLPGLDEEASTAMIFCCNASGDFVAQPAFYTNPLSSSNGAPLQFRSVTRQDFYGWFESQFVPQVEAYLKGRQLPVRGMLLLALDPNHPSNLKHQSFDVATFQPDGNSSYLPIAQGILTHFKAVYTRQVCLKLQKDVKSGISLEEAWDRFSFNDTTKLLKFSIADMNEDVLRGGWAKLLDDDVLQYSNEEIVEESVAILRSLGLRSITEEDIYDQIQPREMTNEEIMKHFDKRQCEADVDASTIPGFNEQLVCEGQSADEEMDYETKLSMVNEINRHLAALSEAQEFLMSWDKNKARSEGINKKLKKAAEWMREMRDEIEPDEEEDPVGIKVKCEPLNVTESDDEL